MTFVTRCAAALIAIAALAGCGGGGDQPTRVTTPVPSGLSAAERAEFVRGSAVAMQSGCLACHAIGRQGNDGPGPDLSDVGQRLPAREIARTLRNPTAPMPSFRSLPPARFRALVAYLARLNLRPEPRRPHVVGTDVQMQP